MKADLHTHSIYSDGSDTPEKIAKIAKENKVEVLSITDHDTAAGLDEKIKAAEKYDIKYLRGLEFSAYNGGHVHIIGYNYELSDYFFKELDKLKEKREIRTDIMLDRLFKYYGITLSREDLIKTSDEPVGSTHIARALCRKGYASSVKEAFDNFVGIGCKAYCGEHRLSPEEAVILIKKVGGVAVLAHPGKIKGDEDAHKKLIRSLKDKGLDGIEAHYTTHTVYQTEFYESLAEKLDLIVTVGSDYHGSGRSETIGFPDYSLDEKAVALLGLDK